ncbi:MAG: Gfo/Idh/MocA family oxidoreductase [Pseudomonadota bacterium]
MEKLKTAVIGVGYLGKYHAEKYAAIDGVELVGVVDTDRGAADAIAKKLGTRAFYRYDDLLGQVDAVSIVVPTPAHFVVAMDFLRRDTDVLIEKPITTTLAEADALIGLAEERGLLIQVGHLERFNPAVVALRDIVTVPKFIESHRLSIFKERCTDVSVVLDLMIHDIDIILNFVRSEVTHIHAAGIPVISHHVDIANARLEFASGCVANVTASRISMRNERKIRLFQRDAYISVDFANHGITVVRQSGASPPVDAVIPGMDIKEIQMPKGDALDDEVRAFVEAVRHRRAPAVTGQMGRDALKIALSIMDQIQKTSSQGTG